MWRFRGFPFTIKMYVTYCSFVNVVRREVSLPYVLLDIHLRFRHLVYLAFLKTDEYNYIYERRGRRRPAAPPSARSRFRAQYQYQYQYQNQYQYQYQYQLPKGWYTATSRYNDYA